MKFPEKLVPYRGVITFAVVLMISNLLWKYNVIGDESYSLNSTVTLWGMNISAPFDWMARHVAYVSFSILHFFGSNAVLEPLNIFRYQNGHTIQIIWACSGLKQAYIFLCILTLSRGSWVKKLWFIPLGLIVVYMFNIFRIAFIVGYVEYHFSSFIFLHQYLFKYLFYGLIFGMWVLWEEKIEGKKM